MNKISNSLWNKSTYIEFTNTIQIGNIFTHRFKSDYIIEIAAERDGWFIKTYDFYTNNIQFTHIEELYKYYKYDPAATILYSTNGTFNAK